MARAGARAPAGPGARAGTGARPGQSAAAAAGRVPGWLVPVVPALAELAVGGYRISAPSLWRDEAATISGSQRPVAAILALTRHQDAVHGLYYLLMHPVIAAAGTSPAALRLPSLIAMCLAAGATAVLGRLLARSAALPYPGLAGLLAGLLVTAVPLTTRYAQEARPYALTSLFAVLASYLLVRAAGAQARRWWAAYAVALALAVLFNLFAVLLAVAHGISLLMAARPVMRRWLVACAAAAVVIAPVAVLSAGQAALLNWVTAPDASTVASLVRDFAGTAALIPVVGLLAVAGCVAGRGITRGAGLTLAVVAVPWLVVPPVLLLGVSFAHPVYVERYVVFCLPALALLASAGLIWLGWMAWMAAAARGLSRRAARLAAVAVPAVLAAATAAGLAGPQAAIRQPGSRPDNLRAIAAIVAAGERPGDAILYLPWDAELVGVAYPVPFRFLHDIGLGTSAVSSATLRGLPAGPGVVTARLARVRRLWTVRWATRPRGEARPPGDRAVVRAIGAMRLVGQWRVRSVILSLYASGRPG